MLYLFQNRSNAAAIFGTLIYMQTAYLSSCRFNPGHLSHLLANYKLLVDAGFTVKFVCDNRYYKFSKIVKYIRVRFLVFFIWVA
jgi:hypothetical protein